MSDQGPIDMDDNAFQSYNNDDNDFADPGTAQRSSVFNTENLRSTGSIVRHSFDEWESSELEDAAAPLTQNDNAKFRGSILDTSSVVPTDDEEPSEMSDYNYANAPPPISDEEIWEEVYESGRNRGSKVESKILTPEVEYVGESDGFELLGEDNEECTCNPCQCEELDETESKFDIFSPREDDKAKLFFEKLNQNLIDIQREYCNDLFRAYYPKGSKIKITTEHLMMMSVKEMSGKGQLYLPGNIICPQFFNRRLNDSDTPHIDKLLLQLRNITTINLAYNNFTDDGLAKLALTLRDNSNISKVNLMNNNFTHEGILTLCRALMYRPPLESLCLCGTKFGVQGADALTCLIMSGYCPLDLDISECDIDVEGFQSICTAFHSLDHDIEYPNFLMTRNLPIDLVTLKQARFDYNAEVAQLRMLSRKLSDTNYFLHAEGTDKKKEIVEFSSINKDHTEIQEVPEVLEHFAAHVLEGLIDIRHRLSEEVLPVETLQREYHDEEIGETIGQSSLMPDVVDMITEFNLRKHKTPNEDDQNELISPSLYELDVSGAVDFTDEMEPIIRSEIHQSRPLAVDRPWTFGKPSQSPADSISKGGNTIDDLPTTDELTAGMVAREATDFFLTTAGETAGQSEVPDYTDIVQLFLMSVGDIAQLQQSKYEHGIDMNDEDCVNLLDSTMERVTNLLSPQVPPHCQLSQTELKQFVNAFFNSSHKTFLQLFKNPYICTAIAQEGTLACREREKHEIEELIRPTILQPSHAEIRYIATHFLDGAIKEAARMIGTGDPFGVHNKDKKKMGGQHDHTNMDHKNETEDEFSHALKTLLITEEVFQTEEQFEDVVQGLLETSGRMAAATEVKARRFQEIDKEFKMISDIFIEDLFKQVYGTIRDYRNKLVENYLESERDHEKYLAELETLGRYPYISRPTRLVLNRPLFQHHEVLMGDKLGDFMRDNKTVKELHIRKWNLGEDGMIVFMNGLLDNTNLVLLDLSNNELAADGVKPLGVYLSINKNLKHLILNHNRLKDPGLLNLISHIEDSGLESLNIAYNNVTWVGLDPLLTILPSTKIRYLYLWGNAYGFDTWDLLNQLMAEKIIEQSDICLQIVDGKGCVVKNSQFRDTNFWYGIPSIVSNGVEVPMYYHYHGQAGVHVEPDSDEQIDGFGYKSSEGEVAGEFN